MQTALDDCYIDGITTNLSLLRAILNSKEFKTRKMNISFISKKENRLRILEDLKRPSEYELASLVAALAFHNDSNNQHIIENIDNESGDSLWNSAARWLNRKKPYL